MVNIHTIGLKGSLKEIQPFHKSIKAIVEKIESDDFHGSCRVSTESADGLTWQLKIITPPVPEKHRLTIMLEAVLITASFDKRVYSWCTISKEAIFEII